MKSEITQRIEQIKNGEIPKGYKKGKLGIVPEDWEEVCFSSLFTSTSDYTDNLEKHPLYSLTIEDGITAKTDRYNRAHLVKKENSYKIVRPNDYAYNPMNIRFGAVARHKGDTPVAVSGYYDIFTTVHQSDLPFMDNFLTCGAMITYYNKVSTGSLVEKQRVHFSDFLKFSLPLPPLAERERIAKILSAQDKVIECYEKKIEQLKRMKKYYLQNMFPKRGETVPKIRFKGFTDPWEQRKVGDCFSERAESDPNGQLLSVTIGSGIRKFSELGRHDNSNEDKSKYKRVSVGDIAYNSMRMWQGASGYSPYNGIVSPAYTVIKPFEGIDSKFFAYLFKCENMIHTFQIRSQGITSDTWNLKFPALSQIDVLFPSDIKEQKVIADYLTFLDNLITLHQRKLEEEKKKKKALQQLLLTGIVRTN